MDVWEWVTSTATVDSILTTLGLSALAFLFARDLILTKAQHLRRVSDLMEHHARELAEKDLRIADIRESRDGYKEAARVERERADKATDSVGEMADSVQSMLHVFQSLDRALPDPSPHPRESAG